MEAMSFGRSVALLFFVPGFSFASQHTEVFESSFDKDVVVASGTIASVTEEFDLFIDDQELPLRLQDIAISEGSDWSSLVGIELICRRSMSSSEQRNKFETFDIEWLPVHCLMEDGLDFARWLIRTEMAQPKK